MNAEIRLSESQKNEVGQLIRGLNNKGAFITAALVGDVLRVTASKKSEIEELKALLSRK